MRVTCEAQMFGWLQTLYSVSIAVLPSTDTLGVTVAADQRVRCIGSTTTAALSAWLF